MSEINEERETLIAKINKAYQQKRENTYSNPNNLAQIVFETSTTRQYIYFPNMISDEIDERKKEIYIKALVEARRLYDLYLTDIINMNVPPNEPIIQTT